MESDTGSLDHEFESKRRKRRFTDKEIRLLKYKLEDGQLRCKEDRKIMARSLSRGKGDITERQLSTWINNYRAAQRRGEV